MQIMAKLNADAIWRSRFYRRSVLRFACPAGTMNLRPMRNYGLATVSSNKARRIWLFALHTRMFAVSHICPHSINIISYAASRRNPRLNFSFFIWYSETLSEAILKNGFPCPVRFGMRFDSFPFVTTVFMLYVCGRKFRFLSHGYFRQFFGSRAALSGFFQLRVCMPLRVRLPYFASAMLVSGVIKPLS